MAPGTPPGHFSGWPSGRSRLPVLLEVATVLTNDEFDFESDLRNRHRSAGGHVSSSTAASVSACRSRAAGARLLLAPALALATVVSPFPSLFILAALGVLAVNTTVPPKTLLARTGDRCQRDAQLEYLCGYTFRAARGRTPGPGWSRSHLFCHSAGHHAVGDSRLFGRSRGRQGHDRRPPRSRVAVRGAPAATGVAALMAVRSC